MSEESIIEGNKTIMFFDGAENSEIEILGEMCPAIRYKDSYYPPDKLPQFDKDWSLLMPIVQKINYDHDDARPLADSLLHWNDITKALCQTDIKQVWQMVIEFIQWFTQK